MGDEMTQIVTAFLWIKFRGSRDKRLGKGGGHFWVPDANISPICWRPEIGEGAGIHIVNLINEIKINK